MNTTNYYYYSVITQGCIARTQECVAAANAEGLEGLSLPVSFLTCEVRVPLERSQQHLRVAPLYLQFFTERNT
jgi:hypothetical protein